MTLQANLVRERFDSEAEIWDGHYGTASPSIYTSNLLKRRDTALSLVANVDGRVLEIGCGSGDVVLSLTDRPDLEIWGLDFSKVMLARSRVRAGDLDRDLILVNGDATALPLRTGTFDTILCLGVLDYVQDHLRVLDECGRLLREGGKVIISVPNARSPFVRADDLGFGAKNALTRSIPAGIRGWLKREILGRKDVPYYGYTKHRYNPEAIGRDLTRAGFRIDSRHYCTYGLGMLGGNRINTKLDGYLTERSCLSKSVEMTGWTHILSATRMP